MLREVDIAAVKTDGNRKTSEATVRALAESFKEIGLLNPITVDPDLRLIAGGHRLKAAKSLGWKKIYANVQQLDDLKGELARIDENLCRNEGTALDRADALARRKEIYEALHPATRRGGAPGKKGGGKSKNEKISSFAKDTAAKTGKSERSVQQYVEVSKKISPKSKKLIAKTGAAENLSDLQKLAKLPLGEQERIAERIAETGETVKAAVRSSRKAEAIAKVREYVPPAGEYPVIVTDVSWPYDDQLDGSDDARGGLGYPSMTLEEIAAMQIPAAADCILFFWITNSHLAEGNHRAILERWGFTPKTVITWEKDRMGVGRYLRNITEHVIVAVKGRPTLDLTNQTTHFKAPVGEHSEKPDRFYEIVSSLCPAEPKLEMFARKERPGWVTSGAELPAAADVVRERMDQVLAANAAKPKGQMKIIDITKEGA